MLTAEQLVPPVAVVAAPHPLGQARSTANLTPPQVRVLASSWVEQGHLEQAALLVSSALQENPKNEDLLVIKALICEVRHDWPGACSALQDLIELQAHQAPSETWCHYVRVLRCMNLPELALEAAAMGLKQHQGHPVLMHEFNVLSPKN